MARVKWSGYIDPLLVTLVKKQAMTFERSEGYIVEMALREMFKKNLPARWKPGPKEPKRGG